MSKSIHIIGSRIGGGAESFYARLINSLSETTNVQAINPAGSPSSNLLNPSIKQYHPRLKNNYDFLSMAQIRKATRQTGPCIVQSYMGRATRLTRIPRNHGFVHTARLGGYYNLKAYRHAHHLIGNTKGICNYLIKEGVPKNQVHYIGNFVEPILPPSENELRVLRESLGIPEGTFVITCAARFHPNKGLPELLEAFSKVWENHPETRLILVGDGPLAQDIHKQVQMLGIEKAVILPGWCDPTPYYHLADVLTSPSRHEPLGNTILEAWACRKPLVATATLGAIELITPEVDGLVTPLKDSDALASAFEQLIDNEPLRNKLALTGAKTVQSRFSKTVITQEYLTLYKMLLTDR